MIDWTKHKFVLNWIKDNLSGYQFLTPEAKQIKSNMESNPLESEEDNWKFGETYEEFLQLIERNPFTMHNTEGKQAAIFANDFYFFIYPTKQNILIPIGLQIEMGITDNKVKAREFKERLATSVDGWKEEYESANKEKMKLPRISDEDAGYEQFLDQSGSTFSYVIRQSLVFILIAICLGGNLFLYTRGIYEIYGDLQVISFWGVTAIALLYLLKSMQWIIREKKRSAYISTWKGIQNKKTKENIPKDGFRSWETFQEILEKIESQKYQKGIRTVPSGIDNIPGYKEVDLKELEQEKVRNKLYTINNSHILAMLAVLICFCSYAKYVLPQAVDNMKKELAYKMDEVIISPYLSGLTEEECLEALDSVNLELQVLENDTYTYSDIDRTQINGIYSQNSTLLFLGTESVDGQYDLCHFIDPQHNTEGYIEVSTVRLKDANEIVPTNSQVVDSAGLVKIIENADTLFDGRIDTYIELEQEDAIKMTFSNAIKIRNLYIMSDGVKGGQIIVNSEEPYIFTLPANGTNNGYVIPMPEENVNLLEIKVISIFGTAEYCNISELLLCR